jgi:glycosyltransferase involved in cell wall biosynthesis
VWRGWSRTSFEADASPPGLVNILVLTSTYPKFEGDSTAPFIESLVRHTAQLGHEVHVVVPQHRDWNRPAAENGVYFHPFRYSPIRSWTPWGYAQSLQGGTRLRRLLYALAPGVALSAAHTCSRVARERRIDVIHAHWLIPNGPIAARAARHRKLPLVVTAHGSDVALAERTRWSRGLAAWTIDRADVTTAASRHLLERLADLRDGSGSLELVPLGTDLGAFHPDEATAMRRREQLGVDAGDLLVLGIGRLVELKGFEYLIRALALARESAPHVRLVVAGEGDARDQLVALARSLDLVDSVTFVGAVRRNEVPSYFAASDVVAIPTVLDPDGFVEGLGYVALEAQAAGKPVVASRVGGLPEAVRDGETGILVAERDPGALANAIVALANDAELRRRLGENARARALLAPSWDDVARMWAALYRSIVSRSTPQGRPVGETSKAG